MRDPTVAKAEVCMAMIRQMATPEELEHVLLYLFADIAESLIADHGCERIELVRRLVAEP